MEFIMRNISISMVYKNHISRFLLTEEFPNIWTGFRNPYADKKVEIASNRQQKNDEDSNECDLLKNDYIRTVPRAKLYKDILLQGYCVSPLFLNKLDELDIREDDIFLISYPRSGTTWTEEILSSLYYGDDETFLLRPLHFRVTHLEVGAPFGQKKIIDNLKSPRLLATHLPYDHCPIQLKQLKCKIVYVVRNPKDQMVSYFHFHETAQFLGGRKWPWPDFLNLYMSGSLVYGSWFNHVKTWWQQAKANPDRIFFIAYEELSVDLPGMVKRLSEFFGRPITESQLKNIADRCSFSHMKDNKAVNRTEVPIKDFFDQSNQKFMRKGIIGDWINYFTVAQSRDFDILYRKEMELTGLDLAFSEDDAVKLMAERGRIIQQ